ncbi:MAG TPA: glutathione S-transferase family protein [Candidatus Binataceae bacterium]|nr:glutathione S-transferase family protein [Candidatus Binataceae bacterium]
MPMLIEGKWSPEIRPNVGGRFIRADSQFRDFITADGSSGYKAEPGRYHLYVAYGCPWANRTIIMRKLKGLETLVSISISLPAMTEGGWTFEDSFPGSTIDQVNGFHYLYEAYAAARPSYTGSCTVPTLWDRQKRTIVNNESSEILRMFNSAFDGVGAKPGDYYPAALRPEIDRINEFVYHNINNGVYKTGFATTQQAYDEAVENVFIGLDTLEERLAHQRYLVGNTISEADWRLFVTLVRFDAAYYGLFKCNLRRLESYHNLYNYMLDLYQQPGVAECVRLDHIVINYYGIKRVNPNGIIPKIPRVNWMAPHDRARLGGR